MERVPGVSIGANRARWLAELSESLDEARLLLLQMSTGSAESSVMELHRRIEGARLAVQALQLRSMGRFREVNDPKCTNSPPQQLPEEQDF